MDFASDNSDKYVFFFFLPSGRAGLAAASTTGTLAHWFQNSSLRGLPRVPRLLRQQLMCFFSFFERLIDCVYDGLE